MTRVSVRDMCAMNGRLFSALESAPSRRNAALRAAGVVLIGSAAYGFVFGMWRAPLQGVYAAVKLPVVLFSVVLVSGLVNTMLAQLLGAKLSLGRVCLAMLLGMAVAAAILGALSPVTAFFTLYVPGPEPEAMHLPARHPVVTRTMQVFWSLLLAHVVVIGVAGLIGNIKLYRFLKRVTGSARVATRVLIAWLGVSGFAGCEIAWLLSPFLCKPTFPPHVIARTYFDGNFYEQIYRAITEVCVGM